MSVFRSFRFVMSVLLVLGLVSAAWAQNPEHEIVTTGTVVLNTPATILVLEMTVLGSGSTAEDARARTVGKTEGLIADFRRFGIKPDDWVRSQQAYRRPLPEEPKKTIFLAATTLVVRLNDFSAAIDMMDRATMLDAASVRFRFEVSDPQTEYESALKRALADARFKAEALAAEGGVKLGALTGCEETTPPPQPAPWSPLPSALPLNASAPNEDILVRQKAIDLKSPVVTTVAQVRVRFAIAQ